MSANLAALLVVIVLVVGLLVASAIGVAEWWALWRARRIERMRTGSTDPSCNVRPLDRHQAPTQSTLQPR